MCDNLNVYTDAEGRSTASSRSAGAKGVSLEEFNERILHDTRSAGEDEPCDLR
jgi:hypothetical protein